MNEFYLDWASHWNISTAEWKSDHEFDQSYLDAALLEGVGGTQVFGMRLQWRSLYDLSSRLRQFFPDKQSDCDRFSAALDTSLYIHLSRQDKIAQAVSLLRAEQSGLWHVHPDGTERERLKQGYAPVYDSREILRLVTESKEHDAAWLSWFAQQEIQPVCITYEMLIADSQTVIENILSALSLDPAFAKTAKPKTAKLSSSESAEWVERFSSRAA